MLGSSSRLVTLRPDLAPALMEFDLEANQRKFIALRLSPVVEVSEPMGNWGRLPLKELLRKRNTNRQADGSYSRGDMNLKPETYSTLEHGTEEKVDDNMVKTLGNYYDAELVSAARARHMVLAGLEDRTIAAITAALVAASYTTAVGTKWNTPASATPIDDTRTAALAIWARTGIWPNSLTLSKDLFEYLKDNAQIIDRLKYAGFQNPNRMNINEAAVAQALGLDEVLVAGAVQNTANEGQDAAIASVWDRTLACLSVTARSANPQEVCLARTFHWGGDGSSIGTAFETYRDETVRADIVRARMQTDEHIMYVQAGHLLTGVYA